MVSGTQGACNSNDQTRPCGNIDRQATKGIDAQPGGEIIGALPLGTVFSNGLNLWGDGGYEEQMGEAEAGAGSIPSQRTPLLQRLTVGVDVGDGSRHGERE